MKEPQILKSRFSKVKILMVWMVLCTVSLVLLTLSNSTYSTRVQEPLQATSITPDQVNILENIPKIYAEPNPKLPKQINKTCAKFPQLFDIKFTNDLWQNEKTSNGTLQLFNAYIDDRPVKNNRSAVRIMSLYDQFDSNGTFYCQLWYNKIDEPVLVKTDKLIWIWVKGWGGNRTGWYHPYVITCLLPDDRTPMSVSVVENACDNATNNLGISYQKNEEEKKNFVVCVKGLSFPYEDKTLRLIEWIELLFILGADKINFYEFNVHPNVEKLLDYYSRQGKIEVTPITLVGGASNTPYFQSNYLKKKVGERRLQEVIPYTDCLYKHLQEYKFVVLLDIDEVIVPSKGTWVDLIETIRLDDKTSYMARNVYFLDSHQHDHDWFDEVPRFMHMLQHVNRAENYTKPGAYVKGFHNTERVVALHNHFPMNCLNGCRAVSIDVEHAHLQHYRSDCVKDVKECEVMRQNSVEDKRLWNYKDELVAGMLRVLNELTI